MFITMETRNKNSRLRLEINTYNCYCGKYRLIYETVNEKAVVNTGYIAFRKLWFLLLWWNCASDQIIVVRRKFKCSKN